MIGQAVTEASLLLREKVVAIAAHLLEASPDDLEVAEGVISVKGTPDQVGAGAQVAKTAYQQSATLPPEIDSLLEVVHRSMAPAPCGRTRPTPPPSRSIPPPARSRSSATWCREDCGRMINPNIVEGQVHGGVAQGIGGVLYEHNVYDDDGNPLASTFMDYLVPDRARDPRRSRRFHIESPASTVGGYKGVGEGGAIGAPAAVFNAVADALAQHGVTVTDQPRAPTRCSPPSRRVPVGLASRPSSQTDPGGHERDHRDRARTTTRTTTTIDADPYPVWKRLRDEAPLYWNEQYGFYALSRYDDVLNGLLDTETFRSATASCSR